MSGFKPKYYVGDNPEEYEELRKGWDNFLEGYSFSLDDRARMVGVIDVEKDSISGAIRMAPKEGRIEALVKVGNPEIIIESISQKEDMPIRVDMLVNGVRYRINYSE